MRLIHYIIWKTKRQTHVALSSAEAEFMSMSMAARELVNVREKLKRLFKLDKLPIMYEDNKAAIAIVKSKESKALKHIVNLCYHCVRAKVAKRNLIIE